MLASFPDPRPASRRLQYEKLGEGLGTRLNTCNGEGYVTFAVLEHSTIGAEG